MAGVNLAGFSVLAGAMGAEVPSWVGLPAFC